MSQISEFFPDRPVKAGNTRVTGKEQYYTPTNSAVEILGRVLTRAPESTNRTFLEPAGGTGAFIEAAKSLGFREFVSMDIEPKHPNVKLGDFLNSKLDLDGAVCVTNPPFGRNNSLSIPFFNHAAKYSHIIAFVVPRSWRKWSVLNRLDANFHLVDDWDLELDYVDELDMQSHGKGNLKTCVQVWVKDENRLRPKVTIPDHGLIQKTTPEAGDVSFTLFGYGCGTVKEEFVRVKNTTQAFFKLKHPRALEALKAVDYSRFYNHTAYTQALGLQEINFLLNEYLGLESMTYSSDPLADDYLGLSQAEDGSPRDHSWIF